MHHEEVREGLEKAEGYWASSAVAKDNFWLTSVMDQGKCSCLPSQERAIEERSKEDANLVRFLRLPPNMQASKSK